MLFECFYSILRPEILTYNRKLTKLLFYIIKKI